MEIELESRVECERRRVEALEQVEPFEVFIQRVGRAEIARVIELCQGDHGEAAIRLGLSRTTMWRKLGRKA